MRWHLPPFASCSGNLFPSFSRSAAPRPFPFFESHSLRGNPARNQIIHADTIVAKAPASVSRHPEKHSALAAAYATRSASLNPAHDPIFTRCRRRIAHVRHRVLRHIERATQIHLDSLFSQSSVVVSSKRARGNHPALFTSPSSFHISLLLRPPAPAHCVSSVTSAN